MRKLLILLLLFCSCTKQKEMLPPEKMQDILWDYIKADVYANEFLSKDSTLDIQKEHAVLLKKILLKYNISKETFFENYRHYTSTSDLLNPLLDSIFVRQTRKLDPREKIIK